MSKFRPVQIKPPVDSLPTLSVGIALVHPGLAAEWLKRNKSNRRPKKKHVTELCNAVTRGEWELNGQAVIFDTEDNLIDGQCRLGGIVKSGDACPAGGVPILVVKGVDPKSFYTIDQHQPRTAKDTLYVGEKDKLAKSFKDNEAAQEAFAGILGTAVRLAYSVREKGVFFAPGKLTNQQLRQEYVGFSSKRNGAVPVRDACMEVVKANVGGGVKDHFTVATFAGLYFLMANDDHDVAKSFLDEFANGVTEAEAKKLQKKRDAAQGEYSEDSLVELPPILSNVVKGLRDLLRKHRSGEVTYKRAELPELVAKAWNDYKEDPSQKFSFKPTEQGEERWHFGGKYDPVPEEEADDSALLEDEGDNPDIQEETSLEEQMSEIEEEMIPVEKETVPGSSFTDAPKKRKKKTAPVVESVDPEPELVEEEEV